MGIDDLILSKEIIAVLYPETLVDPIPQQQAEMSVRSETGITRVRYSFLGKNARSICFLVNSSDTEFLTAEAMSFLNKILTACKLKMDDIALVNIANQPFDLSSLKEQFKPKILFLWGEIKMMSEEQDSLPDMQVSSIDNFLMVPVRSAMTMSDENAAAVEKKQKLWSTLKKLFTL